MPFKDKGMHFYIDILTETYKFMSILYLYVYTLWPYRCNYFHTSKSRIILNSNDSLGYD